jgi:hypothetical protein
VQRKHHRALEEFVIDPGSAYVIAAPDPQQTEPDIAIAALRIMSCEMPDMAALRGFYQAWIAELQARQG